MALPDPRDMARDSLAAYAGLVNPKYELAPHVDILIQALEQVAAGKIKRLMISMPPRHSKSETATRSFMAWYAGKFPEHKIMLGTHTQTLADNMGRDIRRNIQSREHQLVFPDCRLDKASHAVHDWRTTRGGEFVAAGMLAPPTGRGADLLVIDDPLKGEDALSPIQREKLQVIYEAGWQTRLQTDAAIVIIGTRWHENDLIGWLLDPNYQEEVDNWSILSFPAIAERDEGWRDMGDALWPEKFPLPVLEKIKRSKNQWIWCSLYQQRPSSVEGIWYKRGWFKEYVWNPHLVASRQLKFFETQPYCIYLSIDTAFETDQHNDFSVIMACLHTPSGDYLLDVYRKRMTADELFAKTVDLAIYWRANLVLVEKKASGHSLVQHLKANPKTRLLPVKGVVPRGQKEVRAKVVAPYVEHGRFHIPVNAEWKSDWLSEIVGFPTAANDDQMDCLSQYLDEVYLQEHALYQFGVDNVAMDVAVNIFDS